MDLDSDDCNPVCAYNKETSISDVNSWDCVDCTTSRKTEDSVSKLASSVQYTFDLNVLEEEILREYKARTRKEQQVCPRTSEPPIDHRRNQETADKSQQMSVKPPTDSATAQQSENEGRRSAKNEYQAATAGTETMHDRSSKAEEVRDDQELTDKECRPLTRRGMRRDEADPSTGGVRDDSERNSVATVAGIDGGEQADGQDQTDLSSRSGRQEMDCSVPLREKSSLAPSVYYTPRQKALEEEMLRDYEDGIKKQQNIYKAISEPAMNHSCRLESGDGVQKMNVEQMDVKAPARLSETERKQFARNHHQIATADDKGTCHESSSTQGIDGMTQSLYTTDGYVEVRIGGKLTGKECHPLTSRGMGREQSDPPTGRVTDDNERNVSAVAGIDGGEQVDERGQTDLCSKRGRLKKDNSVSIREKSSLAPSVYYTPRQKALEEEMLRDYEDGIKKQQNIYKAISEPAMNHSCRLDSGDGVQNMSVEQMDVKAPARLSETERTQFARNHHQIATAADKDEYQAATNGRLAYEWLSLPKLIFRK